MSQEPKLLTYRCPDVIPEDPFTWPRYHMKREDFLPKTCNNFPAYLILMTVLKATILNQDVAQMVEEAFVACEKGGRTNVRRDAAKLWAWNFRVVGKNRRIVLKENPEFTPEDHRKFDATTRPFGACHLMDISNSIVESFSPPPKKRKRANESAPEQPTSPASKKGRTSPAPKTTISSLSSKSQDYRSDDALATTNEYPPITAANSPSGPSVTIRIGSIDQMNSVRKKMRESLKPTVDAIKNRTKSLEPDLLAAKNEITLCNKGSEEQYTRIKELEAQLNTHQTISNHNAEIIKEHRVANEQEKLKNTNLLNVLVILKQFIDDAIDEQAVVSLVAQVKHELGIDLEWESSDKE